MRAARRRSSPAAMDTAARAARATSAGPRSATSPMTSRGNRARARGCGGARSQSRGPPPPARAPRPRRPRRGAPLEPCDVREDPGERVVNLSRDRRGDRSDRGHSDPGRRAAPAPQGARAPGWARRRRGRSRAPRAAPLRRGPAPARRPRACAPSRRPPRRRGRARGGGRRESRRGLRRGPGALDRPAARAGVRAGAVEVGPFTDCEPEPHHGQRSRHCSDPGCPGRGTPTPGRLRRLAAPVTGGWVEIDPPLNVRRSG